MPPKRVPKNFKSTGKQPAIPKASTSAANQIVNSTAEESPETSNAQDKFEEELLWCIHQIKLNLCCNISQKDAEDAAKSLRILENSETPLIKKRSVMRNTFGDYRAKMEEEKKKIPLEIKNAKLAPCAALSKGQFLRRAVTDDTSSTTASSGFKFNFQIPED